MAKKLGGHSGGRSDELTVERPGEQEEEQELLHTESDEVYDHIQSLKEKFGEGEQGRVQVMRRMPDGSIVSLPSLPALTFDVDVVAAKYGGGRYEFKFYKGKQYLGRDSFTIDPSIKPAPEPSPEHLRIAGADAGGAPTWLAAVLDKMGDAIKAMADRPAPTPPTPVDPMAMIRAIGETMKALTPAPAPAPAPAPGLKDQLEMIKSVVDVGTTILDARGDSGGGGGSGDDYMNTVAKLAEPITDLVKLRVQQETEHRRLNPAGRQPRLTLSRNAVTGPAPVAATGGQPVIGVPAWLVEVQKWVPMIVKRARGGKSAEDTAFFILDELSEPTVQALAAQAAQPDFGVKLAQVLPAEMQKYPEWVTEFMAAMHDWLFGGNEGAAEDDDEPQTDGPVGLGGDDDEPVEVETGALDLEAEARRRMAALRDKPEEAKTPEPVPVG